MEEQEQIPQKFPKVPLGRILGISNEANVDLVKYVDKIKRLMMQQDEILYKFIFETTASSVAREDFADFLFGSVLVWDALSGFGLPPVSESELFNFWNSVGSGDLPGDPIQRAEENPFLMVKIAAEGYNSDKKYNARGKAAMLTYELKRHQWLVKNGG